jgi:hypothetical protein
MNKPENSHANDAEGSDEKKKTEEREGKMPLGRQIKDNYNCMRINWNCVDLN